MASIFDSKQKKNYTTAWILISNRCRGNKRGKKTKRRVEAEKLPGEKRIGVSVNQI